MKKFFALILTLVMALSLVACGGGGADRQPAIDAFNKANTAFTEAATIINENVDNVDSEILDVFMEFSDLMAQYKELLEGDSDIAQEDLDKMIAWFADAEQWSKDAKAELEAAFAEEPAEEPDGEVDVSGTLLEYVTPAYLPESLVGTGWEFSGGFLDGAEMEQADAEATLAQYGGTLQIVFEDDTTATMVQGGGALSGTYSALDEMTLSIVFDNSGAELKYAAMFSDVGGTAVLMLLPDDTFMNAIYFTQITEG